jgi:hypothetical protein
MGPSPVCLRLIEKMSDSLHTMGVVKSLDYFEGKLTSRGCPLSTLLCVINLQLTKSYAITIVKKFSCLFNFSSDLFVRFAWLQIS